MDRLCQLLESRRLLSDNALRFDGVNDVVDLSNPADEHLDLGVNATIEMKVNFKALPAFGSKATFMSKGTALSHWSFNYSREIIQGFDTSHIDFEIVDGGAMTGGGIGWMPELNHWYHLALVKTGQNYKTYLDGFSDNDGSSNLGPPHTQSPLQIGRFGEKNPFNGMIDEVRLWNTARTATEIASNRNKTLTGTENGLVGYWDLNDAIGSQTVLDRTPRHANGWLGTSAGADSSDPLRVVLSGGGSAGSISGSLFNDLDSDGIKDTVEGPLAKWKVWLDSDKDGALDIGEPTAITNASGGYTFSNLAAGSYQVREVTNPGWRRTTPTTGHLDITLASGQASTGKNFGNTQKASISGALFNDLDGDGVKDSGESALAGRKIFLDADKDGVWDSTEKYQLTDASGNYNFKTLTAGGYRVREIAPAGWRQTTPTTGYYDIALASGGTSTAKNFGNTQKSLITGSVFNDLDGDKVKDAGEVGLKGWRVFIDSDSDGIWDATEKSILTDASGNWSFKDLVAGSYKVRVVQQTGWARTTPTTGYQAVALSSAGSATGKTFGEKKA